MKSYYSRNNSRIKSIKSALGRPLTLSEKILYSHCPQKVTGWKRAQDYALFNPDRVAMQDATAQMAMLQFMNAGKNRVCVPSTIHCDHLICARRGASEDLAEALDTNAEVYEFLQSAAARYGCGFWKPGAGIIHQEVLENYAFPGGMMVGTDSHTPNAGGLGMLAIGVGGADAVDVMTGMDWELKVPRIIGVRLTGELRGWATPKDVILHLAGILTVKGGTNAIIEYFGPGTGTIPCTGKATICNMGAEVGATCSVFPFDSKMDEYLRATGRAGLADVCAEFCADLQADPEVAGDPAKYYDRVIDINLSSLEPYVNGPFTPDAATPVSGMAERLRETGFPPEVSVSLIGSCTNSSYQDIAGAAQVAQQALRAGLRPKAGLIINPGSDRIKATALRDGLLDILREAGATVMCNACGPCIGQWQRDTDDPLRRNSIVTSFNRNFAKRADGNPNTHAFIVSPQMAVALAFAGRLDFNPATDDIDGFRFSAPAAPELPENGFAACGNGFIEAGDSPVADVVIREGSERLQRLEPFKPWDGRDFDGLCLLIKTQGKCTTDHISMAGKWLRYRGHLENISRNMLMGAVNAFGGQPNAVRNTLTGSVMEVWQSAAEYKRNGCGSIVVAEENYGEGSSREHAAMEPRFLDVRVILAKSFARIHETNLKKQGVLALTFVNPDDYALVREDDRIDVKCSTLAPESLIDVVLHHSDGSRDGFKVKHTYNEQQIRWFKAGSALNSLK